MQARLLVWGSSTNSNHNSKTKPDTNPECNSSRNHIRTWVSNNSIRLHAVNGVHWNSWKHSEQRSCHFVHVAFQIMLTCTCMHDVSRCIWSTVACLRDTAWHSRHVEWMLTPLHVWGTRHDTAAMWMLMLTPLHVWGTRHDTAAMWSGCWLLSVDDC